MMKLFAALFLLSSVHATPPCEVYGISDSPQSLSCLFGKKTVDLSCRNGVYFLNETPVEAAFHYEVEDGPVPLVFKTGAEQLVVTLGKGRSHKATLEAQEKKLSGSCRR